MIKFFHYYAFHFHFSKMEIYSSIGLYHFVCVEEGVREPKGKLFMSFERNISFKNKKQDLKTRKEKNQEKYTWFWRQMTPPFSPLSFRAFFTKNAALLSIVARKKNVFNTLLHTLIKYKKYIHKIYMLSRCCSFVCFLECLERNIQNQKIIWTEK